MLSLDEARDTLRLDGTDNDKIIQSMLDSLPDYLQATTGSRWEDDKAPGYQLAKQCAKFILQLWYDPGASEAARLSNAVDSMLGTLKLWASLK